MLEIFIESGNIDKKIIYLFKVQNLIPDKFHLAMTKKKKI